jgi:hypothetical protein
MDDDSADRPQISTADSNQPRKRSKTPGSRANLSLSNAQIGAHEPAQKPRRKQGSLLQLPAELQPFFRSAIEN